jgi:hypothetical protein
VTLVEEVRIAVDGETSVPLRVQAFGVGQPEPAVEVAFTSVRFAVPDDSVFDFTPPSGSTVTERSLEDLAGAARTPTPDAAPQPTAAPAGARRGWSTVVETSGVQLPSGAGHVRPALHAGRGRSRDHQRAAVGAAHRRRPDARRAVPTTELETLARR